MKLERKILSVPRHVLPASSPPAPSAAHQDPFKPPTPCPRRAHSRLLHFQRLHLHEAIPGVSQHPPDRAAPGGPYLPCRCPGTAAAVPPPSSPADSSGVSGQRRARRAGEMETETHQGLRQREEEREGCPISGSREPRTPALKRRELLRSGGFPALLSLLGGEGKTEGGWRDAGVSHVENDFIILTLLFTSEGNLSPSCGESRDLRCCVSQPRAHANPEGLLGWGKSNRKWNARFGN